MKTRIIPFTILIGLFLVSCNRETQETTFKECPDFALEDGTISDEKEYQIINAIIKNNLSHLQSFNILNIPQDIIIGNNKEQAINFLMTFEVELENELIESYININSTELKWKDFFEKGKLTSEEEKRCFSANNEFPCKSYQNKYPNGSGFLNFTRPAIFEDNKAIVECLFEPCGGIRGMFFILSFENGNWVVTNSFTTIIS